MRVGVTGVRLPRSGLRGSTHEGPRSVLPVGGSIMQKRTVKAQRKDLQKTPQRPGDPPTAPPIFSYQMSGGHPSGPLLLLAICDSF